MALRRRVYDYPLSLIKIDSTSKKYSSQVREAIRLSNIEDLLATTTKWHSVWMKFYKLMEMYHSLYRTIAFLLKLPLCNSSIVNGSITYRTIQLD